MVLLKLEFLQVLEGNFRNPQTTGGKGMLVTEYLNGTVEGCPTSSFSLGVLVIHEREGEECSREGTCQDLLIDPKLLSGEASI